MFRQLAVLCLAGGLLGVSAQAQAPGHWRVYLGLVSGPIGYCTGAAHLWVRETNGKFSLFDARNKAESWTLPMAADGSIAAAETRDDLNRRPVRVTVPAGSGPRPFDILDLNQACRYRMEPR